MSLDLPSIVNTIHREKGIPKALLVEAIQSALLTAAKKQYAESEDVQVEIDPETLQIHATRDGQRLELADLGRIAAQTAKQVIIQKFREAERDTIFDEYDSQKGDLINGTVRRYEGSVMLVDLVKTEAILPRGEQIPGETHQIGSRIRAVVLDVKKSGPRVKIILSRTHPDFVRRLFELEIPEIADGTIQIKALAREAGYRTKVAVASVDPKVDAVGACVGMRGARIKNINSELGGERIDIVRWNDSLMVLIPNALAPAEIDEVMLCNLLGRAIVLVREDQLSLAIGRRGQNVRLASKLVGWDIEIMTDEELNEVIDRAIEQFTQIEGVTPELAEKLVEQGILSYDDLSVMEPDVLVETIEGLDPELVRAVVARAEALAEQQTDEERGGRKGKGGEGRNLAPESIDAASASAVAAPAETAEAEAGAEASETEAEAEAEAEAGSETVAEIAPDAAETELETEVEVETETGAGADDGEPAPGESDAESAPEPVAIESEESPSAEAAIEAEAVAAEPENRSAEPAADADEQGDASDPDAPASEGTAEAPPPSSAEEESEPNP